MLNHLKQTCLLFSLFITGCNAIVGNVMTSQVSNSYDRTFAVTNVNIVDVKEQAIRFKQTVCVVDGIIARISESMCANNVNVIDGNGGYLTPGLIDMHVHMFEKEGLVFALSHGVTHVRLMNGVSAQLKWRDKAESGELLSSTASVSSPIISGYEGAVLHHGLSTAEEAQKAVMKYHTQGYDLIKVYNNLSEDAFSALIEQSRKLGIPVAKDGPDVPLPLDITDYGDLQSFEHVENIFYVALNRKMDITELDVFIEKAKKTGVPITPTINIFDQLTRLSVEKESFLEQLPQHYISNIVKLEDKQNQVKRWLTSSKQKARYNQKALRFLLYMTKKLYDAEIPLLIGTDSGNLLSPHGLATHNEMDLFVKAGIEPFSVIKSATYNAAKTLKLEGEIGQIKEGLYADFIFTREDPTKNLAQLKYPLAVSKRGAWLNDKDLENLRIEATNSKSLWPELKIYSEMITR